MKTKHIHKKTLIALSSVLFVAAGVLGIKVQSDHKRVTKAKADSEKPQEENEIKETPRKQPVAKPVVAPAPPLVVAPPAPVVKAPATTVKPKPVYTPAPAPKPAPAPTPAPTPPPKTTKTS